MPISSLFQSLISDLKDEIGQSSSVAVGVDYLSKLKRDINRAYRSLYDDYDWPHLRLVAPKALIAGSRYYDFPTGFELFGVQRVVLFYNNQFHSDITRGISAEQYAVFNSYDDVRSDPVLRWDTYWSGSVTQFEVWPIPVSNDQDVYFFGKQKISRLVDNDDVCLLDDEMVVLFAAIRILARQDSKDAKLALQEAQARFATMRKTTGPTRTIRMGMGSAGRTDDWNSGKIELTVTGR
jgi:hypothetical protein